MKLIFSQWMVFDLSSQSFEGKIKHPDGFSQIPWQHHFSCLFLFFQACQVLHRACQEFSAAFSIGPIEFRLLPNSCELPGRSAQSIVSLFDIIEPICLAGRSSERAEESREEDVKPQMWRLLYQLSVVCVSVRWVREREEDYLHVENFIRTLGLPCDITDFIGGLRWQRGWGVAVHRGVADESEGERKPERDDRDGFSLRVEGDSFSFFRSQRFHSPKESRRSPTEAEKRQTGMENVRLGGDYRYSNHSISSRGVKVWKKG